LSGFIPDKGDIVWLNFDPGSGNEIMKRRPAFVISRRTFNAHTGMAIVAPITSRVRGIKLEVVLPDDLITKGAVLIHQMKSLDFVARQITLIERASKETSEQVTDRAKLVIA